MKNNHLIDIFCVCLDKAYFSICMTACNPALWGYPVFQQLHRCFAIALSGSVVCTGEVHPEEEVNGVVFDLKETSAAALQKNDWVTGDPFNGANS